MKDKRTHLSEETKERLSFLQPTSGHGEFETNGAPAQPQLSTIQEINTTGELCIFSISCLFS